MTEKPITREEVRLTSRGAIATLPRRGCKGKRLKHGVGFFYTHYSPRKDLWRPLLRRLKVEMPEPWGTPPRSCVVCDKEFLVAWRRHYARHYSYSICSDKCVADLRNMTRRRRRRKHAAERQKAMGNRTCVHCGVPLDANRATKRYCSVRCRVAAHRAGSADL